MKNATKHAETLKTFTKRLLKQKAAGATDDGAAAGIGAGRDELRRAG